MKLQYIPIATVRKLIEDSSGDADFILWYLDRFEAGDDLFENEDEDS